MSDDEILYHYCSNGTFINILNNDSIHLSSLDAANDYREGLWIIERLEHILRDGRLPDTSEIDNIILDFRMRREASVCLSFCMSKDRDDLSQWRGYADDACGVAIGFNRKKVEHILKTRDAFITSKKIPQTKTPLQFLLQDVEYSEDKLDDWLNSWLINWASDEVSNQEVAKSFGNALFKYKKPTFSKEEEVRAYILANMYEHAEFVEWKARGNFLVPFIEVGFWDTSEPPIEEVWLGPRNSTNITHLKAFLARKEKRYGKIHVHRSSASYR